MAQCSWISDMSGWSALSAPAVLPVPVPVVMDVASTSYAANSPDCPGPSNVHQHDQTFDNVRDWSLERGYPKILPSGDVSERVVTSWDARFREPTRVFSLAPQRSPFLHNPDVQFAIRTRAHSTNAPMHTSLGMSGDQRHTYSTENSSPGLNSVEADLASALSAFQEKESRLFRCARLGGSSARQGDGFEFPPGKDNMDPTLVDYVLDSDVESISSMELEYQDSDVRSIPPMELDPVWTSYDQLKYQDSDFRSIPPMELATVRTYKHGLSYLPPTEDPDPLHLFPTEYPDLVHIWPMEEPDPLLLNLCLHDSDTSEPFNIQYDLRDASSPSCLNTFEQIRHAQPSQPTINKGDHPSIQSMKQPEHKVTIGIERVLPTCLQEYNPSFMDTISDIFQETLDEMFIKELQVEFSKLRYISELLSYESVLTCGPLESGETTIIFYFNEHDDVFEYYFKDYASMGRIIGVGVEYGKVFLENGWLLKVKELSREDWENGLKNCDSASNTLKVIVPERQVTNMDTTTMENLQQNPTYIPKQRSLLLDIAKYFVLKTAIDSFLLKDTIITCTNNSECASSSSQSTNQAYTNSKRNTGTKLYQTLKNLFNMKAFNQVETEDVIGGSSKEQKTEEETTVHLELLPGGCLSNATNLDNESKILASQLDNTIFSEMQFTFKIDKSNRKEIKVTIGPVSFQFQVEQENNYMETKRFGWFHRSFDVSFGVSNAECAKLCTTYKALDVKEVKETYETSCTDATMSGIARTINGKVDGSLPQFVQLTISGSQRWSTDNTLSKSVGRIVEEFLPYTRGGFSIIEKPNLATSTLKYSYLPRDYMNELDHEKLLDDDHRRKVVSYPICIPQQVQFQGIWQPKDLQSIPHEMVEYIFEASRLVQMTSKQTIEVLKKRKWSDKILGHGKQKTESRKNDPLVYMQRHLKSVYLNHSMTQFDLIGPKFEYWLKERLCQGSLNQIHTKTYLTEESSINAPSWNGNPLLEINFGM